jgi:hypothetical protein
MSMSSQEGILSFWIIHKPSGITIFTQQFQKDITQLDPDLIGGFLIALMGFAEELAHQRIDLIQLTDVRLQYAIKQSFIMVVLTGNACDPNRIRILLDHVEINFLKRYKSLFPGDDSLVIYDLSIFQDFAKETEEIFQAETQYLTIMQSRSKNLEEFFQNSSKQWTELHQKFRDQVKSISDWMDLGVFKINKTIQRDLLIIRRQINDRAKIFQKNPQKVLGEWI